MRFVPRSRSALIATLAMCVAPAATQDRWTEAEKAILRLAPTEVRGLPEMIVKQLEARGCTIPLIEGYPSEHNAVRGEFLSAGQFAWAVLCSVDGASGILVFDSDGRAVADLARRPDRNYLQGVGGRVIGYGRLVRVAPPDRIRGYYDYAVTEGEVDRDTLPDPTHDGIDDGWEGSVSRVHYFIEGKWISLPGAD